MTTGIIHDQKRENHIEKHMGCMAGFFQIFDRHQILSGKRLYATKRLPPAAGVEATPVSRELEKPQQTRAISTPSPDRGNSSPAPEIQSPATILPLPIFDCKEGPRSSWKFCKEAPRLSLDSRATVDAKGSLYPKEIRANPVIFSVNRCEDSGDRAMDGDDDKRRSPSVIGRLMGLEQLPNSSPEPGKNAELRRSASESRVSRDFFKPRFVESYNSVGGNKSSNVARDNEGIETATTSLDVTQVDPMVYCAKNMKSESPNPLYRAVCASPWKVPQQSKSFFDSQDIFPEPKPTMSIYGEIEKRLKMRGIDNSSKDLETLKQILEALQLKGLLHSKKASEQISHRNFVYERSFSSDESPIVIMKPSINGRFANDSPPPSFRNRAGVRRNLGNSGEGQPSASPRRERPEIDRNARNQSRSRNSVLPSRNETSTKNPSSPVRKMVPLSVETQRRADKLPEQRRASPIHSPRLSPKRTGSGQIMTNGLPRNRKPTAVIEPKLEDESSSVSESSFSTSSQTDNERSKMEESKVGRSLLERCDKLLHSIMEMTATESQPSPVSVLDSSFYKDESLSPSPVMKPSTDFKDPTEDLKEEIWSPAISLMQAKRNDESDDSHFVYIADILRATRYLPKDSDVFLLLEKQQHLKGKDTSKSSRLQRKLIFDTITEILHRNRQLPPWKAISWSNTRPSLCQIWSEFRKIRERDTAEKDLFDVICGVLRKDLAGDAIHGWGDCPEEISDAVFHIERLVFKDLIGETIRDLAAFAGNCVVPAPRRKLVL